MRPPLLLACLLASAPAASLADLPEQLVLDNGVVEVRMNLAEYGGAITWFSPSGDTRNLVNNHDRGRQIQQSYYAGETLDRTAEGQSPNWSPWPWNPIQVGDTFMNSSEVVEAWVQDGVAYTKTIPLLWDMPNEPAEATFEQWTELDGNVARVRCRVEIFRTDDRWTQVIARDQEIPALYTITQLPRLMAYVGESAWTNDDLTEITRIVIPGAESFPWNDWPSAQYPGTMFEPWAATVDASGWGVGVFFKFADRMLGGQVGADGQGEFAAATKYISPLAVLAIGPQEVLEFEFDLVLGTLEEIRGHAYAEVGPEKWTFAEDGDLQGWTIAQHTANERVEDGTLRFDVTDIDPILRSERIVVGAPLNRYLHVRMRNNTPSATAQFFWTNELGPPSPQNSVNVPTPPNDGQMRDYVVDMAGHPRWVGTIRRLRFDPASGVQSGDIAIEGIAITNSADSPFPPPDAAVQGWESMEP